MAEQSTNIGFFGIMLVAAVGLVVLGGLTALLVYLLSRGRDQPPDGE